MFSRLFQLIFGHFRTKLLALVIALAIWAYAKGQVTRDLPLTLTLKVVPPAGYSLVYQNRDTAAVRLEGPEYLISRLRAETAASPPTLTRRLEENEVEDGWATLRVTSEWLQLPLPQRDLVQLRFARIQPENVQVFVSPQVQKVLPVKPDIKGKPPEGLQLEEPVTAVPPQVEVSGPAVAVNQLSAVPTEPIRVWNWRAGTLREPRNLINETEVELPNGRVVTVSLRLGQTSVIVPLNVTRESRREKTLEDVPLAPLVRFEFPYDVRLEETAEQIAVTVSGPADKVSKIAAEDILVYVDLRKLPDEPIQPGAEGRYQELVRVSRPPEMADCEFRPRPERVTIVLKNPSE